jgi:hypothetical protein
VTIHDFDASWETLWQMILGGLLTTVELSGGRHPRVEFAARSRAGDPHTEYRVTWS